ncbi:BON domain-containing protein [Brasilonema sp. CT11]|nr:BON domain-containing protein [Brasilonema sp. CT11]
MNKLTPFFISCVLLFGATACQNPPSKTTADAPSSATEQATQPPSAQATEAAQKDAQSEIRRKQLNSDIRAREGRNDALNNGSATKRAARDIESEVRSKLEANIPKGHLTIAASEDGTVTVSGTVTKKDELAKIDTLPKEIKGVTKIVNKATVAQAKS